MGSNTVGYDNPVQNYINHTASSTAKIINGSTQIINSSSNQISNTLDKMTEWLKSIMPRN